MNLEFEFALKATLKEPLVIGAGPFGTRSYYEITGGSVEGERLRGKLLTGGGDWLLTGPDGHARLDVRAQILTHDQVAIYAYYTGIIELNQKVQEAIASRRATDYADQYFRTTPRFETGDARYSWLTQSLFAAEGRVGPNLVEYKVYRLA